MKWIAGFLLVLVVLLQHRLWFGKGNVFTVQRYSRQVALLSHELDQARARNWDLREEIEDLKANMGVVEERARRDLGMIREGETFFQIVERPGR